MVQLYHNRNVNKNSLLFKVDYTRVVVIYELNAATSDEYLSVFYLLFAKTQSTI